MSRVQKHKIMLMLKAKEQKSNQLNYCIAFSVVVELLTRNVPVVGEGLYGYNRYHFLFSGIKKSKKWY